MTRPIRATALALFTFALAAPTQALMIELDYSYDSFGFFSGANATRRDLMRAAADVYESRITDTLTAIDPFVSGGSNFQFSSTIERPDTGATISGPSSVPFDTVIVYVGGSNTLPGTTLGEAGPAGFSWGGSIQFGDRALYDAWENNVVTRGQGDGTGPSTSDQLGGSDTAIDVALWGGTISFDNTANWFFDDDPTTDEAFGGNDFFSVALHELGHVFGIGTSDAWFNLVNFGNGTFTGSASSADQGGAVALNDNGHFLQGTMSTVNGVPQEAALDPSLTVGTRKRLTDLDWAALADIGWEIADEVPPEESDLDAIPVPVPWWPLPGFAAFAFAAAGQARSGARRR